MTDSRPAGHRAVAAVAFDWGGVLTQPLSRAFGEWLVRDRVDPEHFSQVMRDWLGMLPDRPGEAEGDVAETPVHALERGHLAPADFQTLLSEELARRGSPVRGDGLLDRMLAGLAALEPDMIEFVREVRGRGVPTAVLSNSWGEHYPDDVFDAEFDVVVVSGRVGVRKPQPEIFHLVAERLGVELRQCLLVDDIQVNVDGARSVGMQAVLHVDGPTTRRQVRAALDRPSP